MENYLKGFIQTNGEMVFDKFDEETITHNIGIINYEQYSDEVEEIIERTQNLLTNSEFYDIIKGNNSKGEINDLIFNRPAIISP